MHCALLVGINAYRLPLTLMKDGAMTLLLISRTDPRFPAFSESSKIIFLASFGDGGVSYCVFVGGITSGVPA